ncbi:MAG: ABC transporter ATP-binding protein [Chloroflexi bacterium]|nr:ABC transporter ATP-binding protein [Chloroflexota bacterium]
MAQADTTPILKVTDLKTHFFTKRGVGKAVDGVSFELRRGETLGLVGESGCGKSITALSIIGLHPKPAARIVGGEVLFEGQDLLKMSQQDLRLYRGRRIALILQDPMTALNPVFTVGDQLYEPLRLHQGLHGPSLKERAVELLRLLRIAAPERRLRSFPHHLSGGMRQRVVGAIALSCDPDVLIADEPTTSLDVTVQASYLALLKELQRKTRLAILFITHDFGVVAKMCDRVAVMYAGKIVEAAPTRDLFDSPAHPYTEALLNSVPDLRPPSQRLESIEGQPPSIYDLPNGCPFAPRCRYVMQRCREAFPAEVEVSGGHRVSCWRHL